MRSIRRVIGIGGLVALSVLSAVVFARLGEASGVAWAASPLEETEWQVEIAEEGMTLPQYVDRIRFVDGKLVSAIFERKGFPTVSYALDAGGSWTANQKNDAAGSLAWRGAVQGDSMTGTLVWKQPDGKVTNYALVGRPAVEEEAPASEAASGPGKKAKKGFFGCSLNQ